MQFLYQNVLFLMLLPSIILMFFLLRKETLLTKHFSKEVLEKLSIQNKYLSNKTRTFILFLALILMIISLARPVTNEKINESKQELIPIVIAIDVSKSMLANDIYPNRLEFARKKVLDIIQNQKASAIAVILFAKSSFILSPLTQDFISLKTLIDNLDTGMNFDNGTNIFSTLETTVKLLKNYEYKNLILLSDGSDSSDFEKESKYANENNISIYTIATATKKGSPIKLKNENYLVDKNGNIVNVKLNDNIKKLSLNTNGGYINFSLDKNDINEILNDINNKAKKEEFQSKKIKTYTELFYYPLALGIFFLLIAYSSLTKIKKSSILQSFILVTIFSSSNTLFASVLDFQTIKNAKEAYNQKDFNKASKEFSTLDESSQRNYNLANSLYKEKKYKQAIQLYKNAKINDDNFKFKNLHNLANSYAKSNDLRNALKYYENALKIKEDKQTRENYNTVKKALENKDKKNKKENTDKDQKKNEKKNNKQEQKQKDEKEKKKEKEQQNKKQNKDKKQEKNKNKKEEQNQEIKKNEISDNEEKKWLKQLKNKKTNPLLKEVKTKEESNSENPW